MIDRLILKCWEAGLSNYIYTGVVVFAFFIQMIFLIFYRKSYGLSLKKAVLTVLTVYPTLYLCLLVITWAENGFKNWGSNNILRLYMFVPLILIPFSKLLKIKKELLADYLAPSMALEQSIGHTVCPFAGCCAGYPCSWGIYNPVEHERLFPNQWLECIVAFVIFIYLVNYAKKDKYECTGKVFAMFLIIFGFTRFLLEFLRDNEKLFLGISELGLIAIITFVIGLTWMYNISAKNKSKKMQIKLKEKVT